MRARRPCNRPKRDHHQREESREDEQRYPPLVVVEVVLEAVLVAGLVPQGHLVPGRESYGGFGHWDLEARRVAIGGTAGDGESDLGASDAVSQGSTSARDLGHLGDRGINQFSAHPEFLGQFRPVTLRAEEERSNERKQRNDEHDRPQQPSGLRRRQLARAAPVVVSMSHRQSLTDWSSENSAFSSASDPPLPEWDASRGHDGP